jgi:hypothetical protein
MYDVTLTEAFIAGRERGSTWAKDAMAVEGADPKQVLAVEAIEAALGTDRGDTAHGFLRGVRDVVMALPPHARPNVIIEVAKSTPAPGVPRPRRGIFSRIRGTAYGEEE